MKLKFLLTMVAVCLVAGVIYASDPITELNIDLGFVFYGGPSDAYGAVSGQTGLWNSVGLGVTTDLLDTAASSTAVSISVGAGNDAGAQNSCLLPDDHALMDDFIVTQQGSWTVTLAGLANGLYEVYLYAPAWASSETGNMVVNGLALASIPGSDTCDLSFGVSTVRVLVEVQSGTISLVGNEPPQAGLFFTGLAGLQLRGPVDIFTDGFESGNTSAWSSTVD